jgi:hypothetical protein
MSSRIALIALVCVGATGLAVAQTSPSDTTSPSSRSPPKEAPTTSSNASTPSSASSPHQRQAMGKEPNAQQMKDCVAKQKAANSSISSSDAKKACKEELKSSSSTSR